MAKIDLVVATRPNFVKAGALYKAIVKQDGLEPTLVHTGQHYDKLMSDVFFEDLGLPEANVNLGIGSGTHAYQTGRTIEAYESHLLQTNPAGVVVFGDVNATLACALAAVKIGIPVAHVEAGLRSFDMSMPEEINRRMTDVISDLCLITEPAGQEHLTSEGVTTERCHLVGNVMVDSVLACRPKLKSLGELGLLLPSKGYGLMTLHRPVNVDNENTLLAILKTIVECTRDLPLVFPVHPRTQQKIEQPTIAGFLESLPDGKLHQVKPLGYVSMLSALSHAKCVLSDSGGIQSESTTLNVPCLSLRERTEQPITLSEGTVTLVGSDVARIRECMDEVFAGTYKERADIPLWDGRASLRIAKILADVWN